MPRSLTPLLFALLAVLPAFAAETPEADDWQQVVRASPYWVSQGAYRNLATIRAWVLQGEAFCSEPERHILFDKRATFLGYIANDPDPAVTQARLNQRRAALVAEGKVSTWVAGERGRAGYPFALNCHQPEAELSAALARYTGADASARLWGTWDGMRIGAEGQEVSLHRAIRLVYEDRRTQGRISMPEAVLSTLAGKVLIESGGRRAAHSAADARGIMQLSVAALNDCELAPRFHFHRMAQIDCALRLLEQNHRNLQGVFQETFGHLPKAKAEQLYAMLLIQAYHGGVGRIAGLMTDPELNGAARYFAQHHSRFTAGDIALGMIYHNLGRQQLGFASLYYVTDVGIAMAEACRRVADLRCE